jgi:signal transduction histidine kinase
MPVELPELPPQHRRALYRAAQESLTNVQRHASAKNVWMRLQRQDDGIVLVVSDDGVGIPPKPGPGGFGLKGLQERAAQLGGDFHLSPRPGGGTRATFFVPLPFQEKHSFPNDRRQTK